MAVKIPEPTTGGGRTRRAVAIPGAGDVRQPSPRTPPSLRLARPQRAPNIPADTQIAEALFGFGQNLSQAAEVVGEAAERQQKTYETNVVKRAEMEFERAAEERSTKGARSLDASAPSFGPTLDFSNREHIDQIMADLPEDVRETTREALRIKLEDRAAQYLNAANKVHLTAQADTAIMIIDETVNDHAAKAFKDPASVGARLMALDETYAGYRETFTTPELMKSRRADRAQIIQSAIRGYAEGGEAQKAKDLLKRYSQKDDSDPNSTPELNSDQQRTLRGEIDSQATAALSAEVDVWMFDRSSDVSPVSLVQGLFEGKTGNPDIDRKLKALPDDARDKVRTSAIATMNKVLQIRQDQEDLIEAEKERQASKIFNDIVLGRVPPDRVDQALNALSTSGVVEFRDLEAAKRFLDRGNVTTNQSDLLDALLSLRERRADGSRLFSNEREFLNVFDQHGWQISYEDIRTKIVPAMEAARDDDWQIAEDLISTKLGIPTDFRAGEIKPWQKTEWAKAQNLLTRKKLEDPDGNIIQWAQQFLSGVGDRHTQRLRGELRNLYNQLRTTRRQLAAGEGGANIRQVNALVDLIRAQAGRLDVPIDEDVGLEESVRRYLEKN